MKGFFLSSLALAVYLLSSSPVYAGQALLGPGSGGGGGAVLCLTPSQKVKSVELVDLVESTFYEKNALSKKLARLPWEAQVKTAVDRIAFADPQFHQMLRERLQTVKQSLESALRDTEGTDLIFPSPQDLSHGRLPPMHLGCQLVGAALFNEGGSAESPLKISHLVWKHFSQMHKAALVLHEAIYLTHRDIYRNLDWREAPDSSATRSFVGFLFSQELEDHTRTKAEREAYGKSFAYRAYELPVKDAIETQDAFRAKVAKILRPLSPYFLKQVERPLFLAGRSCQGKSFTVKVVDDAPADKAVKNRCTLKSIAFFRGKRETRAFAPVAWDEQTHASTYEYTLHPDGYLEDIKLECPAQAMYRHNPGFKVYCGEDLIADVKASDRNDATGFSIKMKTDFDVSFLADFTFESGRKLSGAEKSPDSKQ